jgi:hypothetical protein
MNVFENIFNMIMDVKEKIKNNIKATINIVLFYDYHDIVLFNDGVRVGKPKATFTLDKKKYYFLCMNDLRICDFLMDMLQI